MHDDAPIGVFDSGLGGLTVLRALIDLLPDEHMIYFGDTGRFPYGPKPRVEVRAHALEITDVLVERGVKALVVACNSAAAAALDTLEQRLDIPVIGVIEPGLRAGITISTSGRVGVIGTVGTIASGAYQRLAAAIDPEVEITCAACPGFVEFVEAGDVDSDQVHVLAERLLAPVREAGVDTLVLGCTHYPLLARTIGDAMGRDVVLVSSADETAFAVRRLLSGEKMLRSAGDGGDHIFLDQWFGRDVPRARRPVPRSRGRFSRRMAMELTVLGCSGSFGAPGGGACSGYLVRSGDTAIWVDCGNGTFGHLQEHMKAEDLSAVVLTHGHPDHCVDIYGLHVYLRYELALEGLPVFAPEGLDGYLKALVSDFGNTFAWHAIGNGDVAKVGDIELRFSRTDHPPPTYAVEARADGSRMIYTADTGPGWTVGAFEPGADLVLSEATYLHHHRPAPIHLSAREAGEAAREAGAERLVLTHLWPLVDPARAAEEGSDAFGAPVTLAAPHMVTTI